MGHVGLTPQAVNVLGGYSARGRSAAEADKIIADARALDAAGAFAVVIEGVVEPIAVAITREIACPTIGIGASAQCDGQVLVAEDMLGMFERVPRFVKVYENIAETISGAAGRYAAEVRARSFPGPEQVFISRARPSPTTSSPARGGGPPKGWWRGLATRRFGAEDAAPGRQPPPPRCAWSPSPNQGG